MSKEQTKWLFTFGYGHRFSGRYVVFSGSYSEARDQMFEKYGIEWCGQYSESQWRDWLRDPRRAAMMEKPLFEEERIV